MRKVAGPTLISILLAASCGACAPPTVVATPQIYYPEDAYQEYTQRSDKVTLSAGDAAEVNARVQVIDPWPPYVADRRIPADGQRMAGAVERSRDVSKIGQTPPPLSIQQTSTVTAGGGQQ
jgi:hypothetical protein